jgi:AraC family transcriptional regulator
MLRTRGEREGEASMQAVQLIPCKVQSVSRSDEEMNSATGGHIRGGLSPRTVRRISEYIDSNIEQCITVEVLANLASLSVSYFVRALKKSIGVTPHEYLMRRRVQLTIKLLSDTDMPLSEIAHAAGFVDHSHFARRFRQHVGMSPRNYRWLTP